MSLTKRFFVVMECPIGKRPAVLNILQYSKEYEEIYERSLKTEFVKKKDIERLLYPPPSHTRIAMFPYKEIDMDEALDIYNEMYKDNKPPYMA
jgi:hypothetical protein